MESERPQPTSLVAALAEANIQSVVLVYKSTTPQPFKVDHHHGSAKILELAWTTQEKILYRELTRTRQQLLSRTHSASRLDESLSEPTHESTGIKLAFPIIV